MNAKEIAVLSVFWQKNGLGSLGVNYQHTSPLNASILFQILARFCLYLYKNIIYHIL